MPTRACRRQSMAMPRRRVDHDDVGDRTDDEQIAGQRTDQRQHRSRERLGRGGQEQHHGRHVRHQVGKQEGCAEQHPGLGERHARMGEGLDRLARDAGSCQRAVDDKQADEQDQQLPVDQAEHLVRMEFPAHEEQARARERGHFARPAGQQENRQQRRRHRKSLHGLPAFERRGLVARLASRRRLRDFPAAAELPGDQRPDDGERRQHRRDYRAEVAAERQLQHLADQHVLRIADQRRGGADVRGAGEREQVRQRVEAPAQAGVGEHRRHREAHDVVAEYRGQRGHDGDDQRQQRGRRAGQARHLQRHARIEAAQPHLRRDHHERKQQQQGRQVDRARRVLRRHRAERHQRDGAEQRDAGAVELQERQPAEDHAEIDQRENRDDRRGHRGISRARASRSRQDRATGPRRRAGARAARAPWPGARRRISSSDRRRAPCAPRPAD